MKKKAVIVLVASSMVLSGCWFTDLFKKWFGKQPEQQQTEDNSGNQQKTIVGIVKVLAPEVIEQNSTLTTVDVKVSYSDGTEGIVSSTSVTLDTSHTGTVTGTAYVGNLSATFTIEVYSNNIPTHHGTFVTTSAIPGDGYTDLTLTNESSDTIEVRAQRVSMNGENVVAGKNSYFVMYNKVSSPLNDVYDISCAWNHVPVLEDDESIGYGLYFSYNYLTLDDIFAGYYSDLDAHIGSFSVEGSNDSFSTSGRSINGQNARYFLIILQTPSSDMTFTGLSIKSNNSHVPSSVEKGTYAYPSQYANMFPGFDNGFPYIGNGSIEWGEDDNKVNFVTLQREPKYDWVIEQFTANGFVYATEVMGMKLYQKPYDSTQCYTYAVNRAEAAGFELIGLSDVGLMTSLVEVTSWPGNDIKAGLPTDAYKAYVTDPGFSGSVAYVQGTEVEGSMYSSTVLIVNKDANLRNQVVANTTVLMNYLQNLVTNSGFAFTNEYKPDFTDDSFSYMGTVKSPDLKFQVSATVMFGDDIQIMQMSFKESVFGAFPLALIRGLFYDNSFPSIQSSNGEYSYKDSSSSSSPEISITALGLTKEELEAYWEELAVRGYSVRSGQSTNYDYYDASLLLVNEAGAFTLSVRANLYSNYATLTFRRSEAPYQSQFVNAMDKIAKPLKQDFATALGEDFCNGHFVVSTERKTIYAMGYGAAEADHFLSVCTYDETLGGYYFYSQDSNNGAARVDVFIRTNYIEILVEYINSYTWGYYWTDTLTTDGNSLIDGLFDVASASGASDYYFPSSTNIKFSREQYSYTIYAFGNTVYSFMESYQAALLTNPNIKYSAYLDTYVNTSTNVGIKFDVYESEAMIYVAINFSFWTTYVDYAKYSDIVSDLADFTHLSDFPSLDVLGENETGYVVEYAYESGATVSMTDTAYNAYLARVTTTFSYVGDGYGGYEYVDANGNKLSIYFFETNHSVSFSYEANYFTSINNIISNFTTSEEELYSNFLLPTQSGNIFRLNYYSISFAKGLFDKTTYISQLLAAGYKETIAGTTDPVYAKVVGHTSYLISIGESDIYFSTSEYSQLLTYDELLVEAEKDGFDSARFDRFVKIDGMENNYYFISGYNNQCEIVVVNGDITVESYGQALLNAGYTLDPNNSNTYIKGETTVNLLSYYGFLLIRYQDSRTIYKSFAKVISQAVLRGYESWRLDYVLAPTQTGDIYALNYAWDQGISFYYDEDNFDVDAYKAALIEAGYTKDNNTYTKGDATIYISTSNHTINLSYSGSNS